MADIDGLAVRHTPWIQRHYRQAKTMAGSYTTSDGLAHSVLLYGRASPNGCGSFLALS
jgi:hypothetical protein